MSTITNEQALEFLRNHLGEDLISVEEPHGLLTIEIPGSRLVDTATFIRDNQTLSIGFLTTLCGMHFPFDNGRELGVTYHFHSLENNFRLRVKVRVSVDEPNVPTLTEVYSAANWQERETFDFFGIKFTGHPDLRRILNMDEMTYHPLRKEFPLEDATREDKADRFFGR